MSCNFNYTSWGLSNRLGFKSFKLPLIANFAYCGGRVFGTYAINLTFPFCLPFKLAIWTDGLATLLNKEVCDFIRKLISHKGEAYF